jgi:hypothetical protein
MWRRLLDKLACRLGSHDWESRGGSFGVGSALVCRRCRRQI